MSDQNQAQTKTDKPADPYQKYKDFKWQNPEQFKNGPIDDESRKCRDCVCCIIFILLFALCIFVAAMGFWKGKPSQLFYFYDDTGHACGHDDGYEEYPYLRTSISITFLSVSTLRISSSMPFSLSFLKASMSLSSTETAPVI